MSKQSILKLISENQPNPIFIDEKSFYSQNQAIIVLTEVGKPVYCSSGNEYDLGPVFAMFSILMNKFERNLDNEATLTPIFFENSKKIHIFEKQFGLWFIFFSDKSEISYIFGSSILKHIAVKVSSSDYDGMHE